MHSDEPQSRPLHHGTRAAVTRPSFAARGKSAGHASTAINARFVVSMVVCALQFGWTHDTADPPVIAACLRTNSPKRNCARLLETLPALCL